MRNGCAPQLQSINNHAKWLSNIQLYIYIYIYIYLYLSIYLPIYLSSSIPIYIYVGWGQIYVIVCIIFCTPGAVYGNSHGNPSGACVSRELRTVHNAAFENPSSTMIATHLDMSQLEPTWYSKVQKIYNL